MAELSCTRFTRRNPEPQRGWVASSPASFQLSEFNLMDDGQFLKRLTSAEVKQGLRDVDREYNQLFKEIIGGGPGEAGVHQCDRTTAIAFAVAIHAMKGRYYYLNMHIVDFGSGAGRLLAYLKVIFPFSKCTGIDLPPVISNVVYAFHLKEDTFPRFRAINFIGHELGSSPFYIADCCIMFDLMGLKHLWEHTMRAGLSDRLR